MASLDKGFAVGEDAAFEEESEVDDGAEKAADGAVAFEADAALIGQRLDVTVTARMPGVTRGEAQRLIERSPDDPAGVWVNDRRQKSNYRLRAGDVICAAPAAPETARALPEAIPLTVVYEDADLLVIDKARGMVVHPAPGSPNGTLVNAVLAHAGDLSGIGGELRPGIVHRLDKDTGGLIMVAKNDFAHRALQAQIQARTAERRYLALIWGVPRFERAQVEAPIGRHPTDRKKMAVLTDPRLTARKAITELTVRETFFQQFALLEAKLQTGRTHQIRVHAAYIQHPIVGDTLYGGQRKLPNGALPAAMRPGVEEAIANLHGQALHAYALAFDHPRTGARLAFTVPLPPPMQLLLDRLRASPT